MAPATTIAAIVSSAVDDFFGPSGGGGSDAERDCSLAADLRPIISFYRAGPYELQCQKVPLKVVNQQDRVLIGGLALALLVVFARPIQYLLDLARDVERSSGLALMPALLILIGVFFFHQQGKRQESKAQAAAAEADASQAEARAVEMERLVTFGQGLGRALELEAIRDVVVQHLPKLAGTDE